MSVDSPTIQQSLCLANCGVSALRSRRYVVERYQQPTWRGANNFHPDVESAPSRSTSHWKLKGGRIVTTLSGTLLLEVVSPHAP